MELLMEYRKKKGHHIVVVFDGWKGGSGVESSSVRGGVKVIYSRLGEKADSVIKRILSTERREWIVVSSDREIANHAWATDSIPVPSEEFLPFLEGTGTAVIPSSGKDGDDTELREERKGNPRKPSRKERAMNRALGKL
jgi:predicted RNA-binding protein with PIN domain